MEATKPLRQNNLVICTAYRHKGPQQNTLNCTGYLGAAPNPSGQNILIVFFISA